MRLRSVQWHHFVPITMIVVLNLISFKMCANHTVHCSHWLAFFPQCSPQQQQQLLCCKSTVHFITSHKDWMEKKTVIAFAVSFRQQNWKSPSALCALSLIVSQINFITHTNTPSSPPVTNTHAKPQISHSCVCLPKTIV